MNEQSPKDQLTTQRPVPIEVKWNIPAWIMTGRINPHIRTRKNSYASGRVSERSSVPAISR